jgi:hypothetical protein
VARVALEVVDSAWWKQQLRVKSAGIKTSALSSLFWLSVKWRKGVLR